MYGKNIICIVRSDYIKNGYRCVTYLTKESIKDVCTTHTEKTVCVCMYLRVSIYHPWGCIILKVPIFLCTKKVDPWQRTKMRAHL